MHTTWRPCALRRICACTTKSNDGALREHAAAWYRRREPFRSPAARTGLQTTKTAAIQASLANRRTENRKRKARSLSGPVICLVASLSALAAAPGPRPPPRPPGRRRRRRRLLLLAGGRPAPTAWPTGTGAPSTRLKFGSLSSSNSSPAFFVEVVSALDEDGALIRLRLTLVELVARPARCGGAPQELRRRDDLFRLRSVSAGAEWASLAFCSLISALRLSLMRLPSMARTFTITWSPSRSSSFTSFTRCSAISEMCSRPSVPGNSSTNAPNSASRTTLPR